MAQLLQITLIGTLAGVLGTGLGGLLITLLGKPKKNILCFVLAFSGGIMLAIVFQDLIPEALGFGNIWSAFLGLILGILILGLMEKHLPHFHFTSSDSCPKQASFIRSGILLGIGIAMHNLPEGLAIGAGYAASEQLGWGLAIVLALHNIPEGMAMAGPMKAGQIAPRKILIYTGLAGLPMGLGTFLGAVFGGISEQFLSIALGFAAGAMLYIVFDGLLPDALEMKQGRYSTFGAVVGVISGLLILNILG